MCNSTFSNNNCIDNIATNQGGCFYTDLYGITNFKTSFYHQNSADYGIDYAAYAFTSQAWFNISDAMYYLNTSQYYAVSG